MNMINCFNDGVNAFKCVKTCSRHFCLCWRSFSLIASLNPAAIVFSRQRRALSALSRAIRINITKYELQKNLFNLKFWRSKDFVCSYHDNTKN